MVTPGSKNEGSADRLREERAGLIVRYTVHAAEVEARGVEPSATPPSDPAATDYVIQLEVAAGFLWWWSLFEVVEMHGGGAIPALAARLPSAAAAARLPHLSRRGAVRAGKHAARTLPHPPGTTAVPAWPWAGRLPRLPRRLVLIALALLAAALIAGAFIATRSSPANPRTEVLRSSGAFSDIWVRITGPGGAVSYVGQRFTRSDFSRFKFHNDRRKGLFLPPRLRERKLCGSTHVIQPGDAPQLQKWSGRTIAITIYGEKTSELYCAVLGYGLYLGDS